MKNPIAPPGVIEPMRLAAAFFVLVLFAGCMGGSKPPAATSTPTTDPENTTATVGVEAPLPAWNIGQGWTYAVETPGKPTRTFEMMLAEDRSDLWVVASNDRAQALHHAVYSTNPVLGRISKTTLSPFQSGKTVDMFRFPLTDGKTWTAKFFGEDMTFTARYAGDIDVSSVDPEHGLGRFVEGFRITAQGADRTVHYDYVEAVEWFTSFEVLAEGGAREIKLTLRDLEADYKGDFFFLRGEDLSVKTETHADNEAPEILTHEGTQTEDFKDRFALGVVYVGSSGSTPPLLNVTLKNPTGATLYERDFMTSTQLDSLVDFAGAPGKWTVDLRLVGNVRAEVRLVGILSFAQGTR